jgi:hypothetical protein
MTQEKALCKAWDKYSAGCKDIDDTRKSTLQGMG